MDICDASLKNIEIEDGVSSIIYSSNCIPTVIRLVSCPEY